MTKTILHDRDNSAMYFDHGWIKKTMHCFSVMAGIKRIANNVFKPDTKDPDRDMSYAHFV